MATVQLTSSISDEPHRVEGRQAGTEFGEPVQRGQSLSAESWLASASCCQRGMEEHLGKRAGRHPELACLGLEPGVVIVVEADHERVRPHPLIVSNTVDY